MFKRAVLVVVQVILFLVLFGVGSLLPALPAFKSAAWQIQTSPNRAFVLDGLLLAFVVYLIILLVEAARKRLRGPGGLTTLAFALALALGLAMRFGFKTL